MNHVFLGNFISFAKTNYHNHNITVEEICSSVGCSKSYMHEILSYECNLSIMQYLEIFRILKAMELILKGEKKVYLKVGYSSSSSFSRTFKRVTGITIKDFQTLTIKHKQLIPSDFINPKEELQKILDQLEPKPDCTPDVMTR